MKIRKRIQYTKLCSISDHAKHLSQMYLINVSGAGDHVSSAGDHSQAQQSEINIRQHIAI